MKYCNLNSEQWDRFISVACSLVYGDCLPLVKYFGNNSPAMFEEIKTTWGSYPTPILYEQAWHLMDNSTISNFVLTGEI